MSKLLTTPMAQILAMFRLAWSAAVVGLLLCGFDATALAQQPTAQPVYWNQRMFFIPYQASGQQRLLQTISKVQLLASRTGANDWATLQEAEPNVQGFSYHAPEDGEYWFAVRHLDLRGQPWPSDAVNPSMRIVVDTVRPELTVEGSLTMSGELIVRYEARDANLQADSLKVEVRPVGGNWLTVQPAQPDIAQPDRLVGRATWRPPAGTKQFEINATVHDRAGHVAVTSGNVPSLAMPELGSNSDRGPKLGDPSANAGLPQAIANPFVSQPQLPSQDWPANNRLPASQANAAPREAPPLSNPYNSSNSRTPALLVGDGSSRGSSTPRSQTLQVTPLDGFDAPPLVDSTAWPNNNSPDSAWQPAPQPAAAESARLVNSTTFDIEYDLQSVGPWGVARVELWGTPDGGRTWQSFGVDPDNRSPMRVVVPEAGNYGFKIVVDGANAARSATPRGGDEAELFVTVDLRPPTAELLSTQLGQGNLSDHLHVTWRADDTNLEPRPIALFYSSYPNGPWSTIASGLENTGQYTWRIERHVPGRFYLRLEARDTAGNLGSFQTPQPVELARPQPTGTLRSVRPVTDRQ